MTPYLLLPHLLSQAWLAYPILSLLFIAFRILLSLDASENDIAAAKSDLLASCQAAERAATSAASMPRYMAAATNKQFADAVNGTIAGARDALMLSLTMMEAIINFIVDIYRSTFLCFLELIVRGSLEVLIGAVQELNSLVNSAASALRTNIQNDISGANNAITSAINAINKINPFKQITPPQITVPSLDGLQNVTLPSSFQDALVQLNNSIPSVDSLKQTINNILDKPFELVKADINSTFANITFDASVLPVPNQNSVTFCHQLDTSVVDDLGKEFVKMAKIGFVILILAALLLISLNCLLIWYKWRCMKYHLEFTRQAWATDPTLFHTKPVPEITLSDHNLIILQADMHHPLIMRIINVLSAKFSLTPTQHANIRWFFHYIFHPPALACFLIGLFGLLCVEMQILALRPLETQFSGRVTTATADFSNTIATAINASMYNQSATYANDVNTRVEVIQSTINNGLFGWVNGTTTTLNNTVNAFYTDIQDAVTTLFNGTVFEQPAQEFIRCFIGSKVDAIEEALTFLHNNLEVNMPRVNESVLVLSPGSVNEAAQPIARAAVGSGNNGTNTGLIGKIIRSYEASLRKERVMFAIFMGLWGIVVLMAICILLWNSYGQPWLVERRRRKWEREQRSGINGLVIPFRDMGTDEKKSLDSSHGWMISLPTLLTPRRAFEPTHPRFRSGEAIASRPKEDDGEVDSFFVAQNGNMEPRKAKTIDTLKAIGRKALGRERNGDDHICQTEVKEPEGSGDVEKGRRANWMGPVTSKLGKDVNGLEPPTESAPKEEPTISTRAAEPVSSSPSSTGGLKSRWSDETVAAMNGKTNSWNDSRPNRRPPPPPPTMPTFAQPAKPKSGVPAPTFPHSNEDAPKDPEQGPGLSVQPSRKPTVVPLPLHHAFAYGTSKPPQPPIFDWTTRPGLPPPPRRMNLKNSGSANRSSPKISTSFPSSGREASRGTTPSFTPIPDSAVLPATNLLQVSHKHNPSRTHQTRNSTSAMPVMRLLTTTHTLKSSGMTDPFVTPFDDERRVTIETKNPARASVMTNPFAGIAL
ncbi:hypothetical protein AX15_003474 [Amanita polypyramis BW_CC]|nr:hypothetical protein AX15_003474 [Amanita polypyramis BW_CC]